MTSTARPAVLAGRTLADLIRNAFVLALQLSVGFALGFRWQTDLVGLLAGLGVTLAFGYACSWIMAFIGLAVRSPEAIQAAVYMVVFPLTLTSSVFVPTSTMPSWLAAFADHQPVTVISNVLRGLMLGEGALPTGHTLGGELMLALGWIAAILVVFVPLAVRTYRRVVS